jgi:hypothetical protein
VFTHKNKIHKNLSLILIVLRVLRIKVEQFNFRSIQLSHVIIQSLIYRSSCCSGRRLTIRRTTTAVTTATTTTRRPTRSTGFQPETLLASNRGDHRTEMSGLWLCRWRVSAKGTRFCAGVHQHRWGSAGDSVSAEVVRRLGRRTGRPGLRERG